MERNCSTWVTVVVLHRTGLFLFSLLLCLFVENHHVAGFPLILKICCNQLSSLLSKPQLYPPNLSDGVEVEMVVGKSRALSEPFSGSPILDLSGLVPEYIKSYQRKLKKSIE